MTLAEGVRDAICGAGAVQSQLSARNSLTALAARGGAGAREQASWLL